VISELAEQHVVVRSEGRRTGTTPGRCANGVSTRDTGRVPGSVSRERAVRAVELDSRTNSLNLIRLVLALMVLFAHGFYIAGAGSGPGFRGESLGGWAVLGFFTISGFLITASRFAKSFGAYLLHRVARIFPAFLVCLVVTAGVAAPIAYWSEHRDFTGFFSTGTSPIGYILSNALLKVNAQDVAGTPGAVPYPGTWNGSLWTLWFEFCCYLIVGVLILLPVVRRRRWIVTVAFAVSVVVWANIDRLLPHLGGNVDLELLARLAPPFLGGAVVQTVIRRVPLQAARAMAAAVLAGASVWFIQGWGAQLAAPLITYALLWLSTVLPSPAMIRRHDISYGAYIYAFPVQQLLTYAGAHRLGVYAFDVLAVVATAVPAALSWRFIERPVMRWARRAGRRSTRPSGSDPPPMSAPEPSPGGLMRP